MNAFAVSSRVIGNGGAEIFRTTVGQITIFGGRSFPTASINTRNHRKQPTQRGGRERATQHQIVGNTYGIVVVL